MLYLPSPFVSSLCICPGATLIDRKIQINLDIGSIRSYSLIGQAYTEEERVHWKRTASELIQEKVDLRKDSYYGKRTREVLCVPPEFETYGRQSTAVPPDRLTSLRCTRGTTCTNIDPDNFKAHRRNSLGIYFSFFASQSIFQ